MGAAGDFKRADVGGLGAEDAAARLLPAFLRAPAALELEDEEEQGDVQEKEDERDFGAHVPGGLKGEKES